MKKRVTILVLTLVLAFGSWIGIQAEEIPQERQLPRLVDDAGLLSSQEALALSEQLNQISEERHCDVAIITIPTTNGMDIKAFADDFYDYNGYGMGIEDNGIMLVISMGEREWALTTYGLAITAFTDAGLDYIEEEFRPHLSDGDYAEAFTSFASLCDAFLEQYETGEPYDIGHMPHKPLSLVWIPLSIGIGAVISLIIMGITASGLKSVAPKGYAADYMQPDSLKITNNTERFLYRNVRRIARESASSASKGGSSTSVSSSGRSHGGSKGKF